MLSGLPCKLSVFRCLDFPKNTTCFFQKLLDLSVHVPKNVPNFPKITTENHQTDADIWRLGTEPDNIFPKGDSKKRGQKTRTKNNIHRLRGQGKKQGKSILL